MKLFYYFKKFGDFIDSKRELKYNFKKILSDFIGGKKIKVLEIGSSDRPLINIKDYNIILHGLDPDLRLNKFKGGDVLHKFYNLSIEEFNSKEKYDLIYLNMVLEHVKDNTKVENKIYKLLKNNGYLMTNQPSNLHPFSIINRIVPNSFAKILIKYLQPWALVNIKSGYKAYYHKTNFNDLNKIYNKKKYIIDDYQIDYNGSDYFKFFPPLFLVIVVYEEILKFLGLKQFCARFWIRYKKK